MRYATKTTQKDGTKTVYYSTPHLFIFIISNPPPSPVQRSLTGPQFINKISSLLNGAKEGSTAGDFGDEPAMDESEDAGKKKKKIVAFGTGTYNAKSTKELFQRNAMMMRAYKNKKVSRANSPSPESFARRSSRSPQRRTFRDAFSPVARMSSLSPTAPSRRLSTMPGDTPGSYDPNAKRQSIVQGMGGFDPNAKRQSIMQGMGGFDPNAKRQSIMQGMGGFDPNAKRQSIAFATTRAPRSSILPGGMSAILPDGASSLLPGGAIHSVSPPTVAPPGSTDDQGEQEKLEMILKANERRLNLEAQNSQAASLLFSSLDYREKGSVTWDEFTSYVVEGFQGTVVSKEANISPYIPTHRINTSYNRELNKIFQIDDIGDHGSLVLTEQGSRSFKIFTPDKFEDLHTLRPSMWTEVKGHDGDVLSVGHIPELGYIATTSTDCTIQFWDEQSYHLCQRLPVPAPILTTEWAPSYERGGTFGGGGAGVLFTGGERGLGFTEVERERF